MSLGIGRMGTRHFGVGVDGISDGYPVAFPLLHATKRDKPLTALIEILYYGVRGTEIKEASMWVGSTRHFLHPPTYFERAFICHLAIH